MELQGLTPVDSLYEYAGFRLAGILGELAGGVGLPVILGLAGLAYVVHASLERGSMRDAAIHLFYLMMIAWFLGNTNVVVQGTPNELRERLDLRAAEGGGVATPRFLAWLNAGADQLQQEAIRKIDADFLNAPFERERLAAALDAADVFDGELKGDLWQFGRHCYRVAVATDPRGDRDLTRLDPLAFGSFPYSVGEVSISGGTFDCASAREFLSDRVDAHLRDHSFHGMVRELIRRVGLGGGEIDPIYRGKVIRRAMLGPRTTPGEAVLVAATLPNPSQVRTLYQSEPVTEATGLEFLHEIPALGGLSFGDVVDVVGEAFVDTTSRVKQWTENQYTMKQKTYLAVLYGPYLYGLALMLVLGLFPVVGLFAILPGRWRALVNYGKVLLSIKLWPVCWAILSRFHARGRGLDAFGENVGSADFVVVLSSMYLLTPVLCFGIVSLVTTVSTMPFQQAVPAPAGSSVGPAIVAARVAGSSARR